MNKKIEIKGLIQKFCRRNLDAELSKFATELLELITEEPMMDVSRGQTNIWAASIVYVISRLNYCFDPSSDTHITIDFLCDHFETVKSTTGNKATQIEKICDIYPGDPDFSKQKITEMYDIYTTREGFLIPASMINKKPIIIETMSPEEEEQFERLLRDKESKLAAEKEALILKRREENRLKRTHPNQVDMF
ncbi:MAG: DUF6398 domain-containing protein [Proteobacteria bacterium]|nr:DUF6398 domain-containing protein [Pseudomonadota bacterium]